VAQPDQANALPQRLPLRLIVPAGAAVLAVALVAALVVPSLVGGGPAGTVGAVPGGSAAPAGSTTTTSTTVAVTCGTWSRNWRDHCESLQLAAPAAPVDDLLSGWWWRHHHDRREHPAAGPGPEPDVPDGDQRAEHPDAARLPVAAGRLDGGRVEGGPGVMLVEAVGVASGTGFQVDSKGHVVTNRHVVSGASKFRVHTTGGRTLTAELLGKSATHDVAVLQVKGLKARPLAWLAGKPKMGLGVLVLGFPGGPHAGHP
jgi:S1-C subfamily serine protease